MRQALSNINERLPPEQRLSDEEIDEIKKSNQVIHDFCKLNVEKFPPEHGLAPDEYAEIVSKAVDEEFEEHFSMIGNSLRTGIYITCFSEIYDSILMWSHYSHHHEGFCIEYNFRELGHRHPLNRLIYPVIYANEIYDMTANLKLGADGNIFMNTYAAINKSNVWNYEQEWRYVFQRGPSKEMQFISTPKPKTVYLGAKILEENKKKILEIAKRRNFRVYQMNMKSFEYALEAIRII